MSVIFDIETRPQDDQLDKLLSKFPDFDADKVPIGNLKDQEKIKKKIIDAGVVHELKRSEYYEKQHKKACLDPDYGKLCAIGLLHIEDGKVEILDAVNNEEDALNKFWHIVEGLRSRGQWAFGWHIEGFDLPFLFGRSRLLNVHYDPYLITNYRYFDRCFVDLHKVWTFGAYGKFCSLKKASTALGFQHLDLGSGKDFYKNWESNDPDKRKQARRYLYQDLDQTMAIATATHGIEQATNKEDIQDDEAFTA